MFQVFKKEEESDVKIGGKYKIYTNVMSRNKVQCLELKY